MADFIPALEVMIRNEGGYNLIQRNDELGGTSFAGITSIAVPNWQGWELVERDPHHPTLISLVKSYYMEQFWQLIAGDDIQSQRIASTLFDFAVTQGVEKAVQTAQLIVGQQADGIMNQATIVKLNTMDEELFVLRYSMVKAQGRTNEVVVTKTPEKVITHLKVPFSRKRGAVKTDVCEASIYRAVV